MGIINILTGILFLLVGQRLYWLFIAGLGFLFGFEFSTAFFFGYAHWQKLVISLIFGLLGLVSALFLQGLAIILTGFITGGYLFLNLWKFMGWEIGWWWILFFISGVVTSILLANFFNPVLILLTSFIGTLLIIQFFPLIPVMKIIFFIAIFAIGIFVQSNQYFNIKG